MTIMKPLPRSTPEAEGLSSSELINIIAALESVPYPNSFMLVIHGKVVAEGWWFPYRQEAPHMLFSLTKSFTSTAVGLAVEEGLLSLDETLVSIFPNDVPLKPSENLKAMRIFNLLTMNTGHDQDATEQTLRRRDRNAARAFLSIPVQHTPGSHFVYNSAASHLLSMIVQQRSGQPIQEYLTPRLFAPLGIQPAGWEKYSDGVNFGGWGLSLQTEDIAKFGLLLLQKGLWEGKRILPQKWIEMATAKQVENGSDPLNDWNQGYGFQFWRSRNNMYRGDGAFGQFCFVIPDKDAVVAITSGVGNMQAVMNVIIDQLAPKISGEPLPSNPQALEALQQRLNSLAIPPLQGSAESPLSSVVTGNTYTFEKNSSRLKWANFSFTNRSWKVSMQDRWGKHAIEGDFTGWSDGKSKKISAAASGGWISQDTFEIRMCLYQTPFIRTVQFRFAGDQVFCEQSSNVGFGDLKVSPVIGQRKL